MNKNKLTFLLLLAAYFAPILCISQNTIADSLIRASEKAGVPDTMKIKLYGDIAWELMASNIGQALEYANKELDLAAKNNRKRDIAQAESDIGSIYNRKSSFDTALIHYNKSLELWKELKQDVKVAGVYANIATIYTRQSKFETALEMSFKSLKLFEQAGDEIKQCITLSNIGYLYYDLDQNKTAQTFYQKSLALARKNKQVVMEGNLLISVAGIKLEEGVVNDSVINVTEMDSALYYYLESEKLLVPNNALYSLGALYNNIGRIYVYKKKYDTAISFYEKGLKNREIVEDPLGVALSKMNLANVELLRGRPDKSIEYAEAGLQVFLSLHNFLNIKQAYGRLAEAYKVKGNYPESLKYYQLYSQYQDSVYSESSTEKLAEMQTKYDTEKKDLEIARQDAEIQAHEQASKRRQTLIFSLIGIILLILVLGYFIYSRNKIREKARMDKELALQREIRSKAVIEAEEKERRRIAQDLHDGVGQILSAAKLNLSGLESKLKPDDAEQKSLLENALELVNDSVKEVRAVSHNMMPNTLIKLGLASAVREFITKIGTVPNLKIDLEIVGMEERLHNTVETVLYRVIQEVVSNIIKHAKANVISMQLIRHEKELTIMIEDNGVGFDKAKVLQFEGIGLKNIISRVEFLSGTVDFDSTIGQGTTVVIEVPLA